MLRAGALNIEILPPDGSVRYLGILLSFNNQLDMEIDHRIRVAWCKFAKYRQELTNKHYDLRNRLKLFDSVITPSFLYCASTWTMTAARESKVTRVQRRMLRMMVRVRRLVLDDTSGSSGSDIDGESASSDDANLEPYVAWLIRSTAVTEQHRLVAGVEEWGLAQRRRYWRWAGHVARCSDGRWTQRLLSWIPHNGYRMQGRPVKRWTDDLEQFFLGLQCDRCY